MAERDPRVDPKRGDKLRTSGSGSHREILVAHEDEVKFQVSSTTVIYTGSVQSWRKWAKNAEVIHRAD